MAEVAGVAEGMGVAREGATDVDVEKVNDAVEAVEREREVAEMEMEVAEMEMEVVEMEMEVARVVEMDLGIVYNARNESRCRDFLFWRRSDTCHVCGHHRQVWE